MSRRLFAVALLPSAPLVTHVDGVRATLDDPRRGDLPTHLTLVPPSPARGSRRRPGPRCAAAGGHAERAVRAAPRPCSDVRPRTSTLHLEVHGELERLHRAARTALRVPPLDRPRRPRLRPPRHAAPARPRARSTQASRCCVRRSGAGRSPRSTSSNSSGRAPMSVAPRRRGAVGRPTRVVGRGGVELHLRATSVVEPGVAALAGPVGGSLAVRRSDAGQRSRSCPAQPPAPWARHGGTPAPRRVPCST